MSTQAPAPNQTTALQVWSPADVVQLMDAYPERAYNRLFPVDAISQVNPMLAPRIELIRLNPDEAAGEIYHDPQMRAGHFGPTKVGLRRLSDLASISTVASRRMDDGSDPWYVLWQVEMELAVPGRRPRRGIGSKEIRLSGEPVKGWTAERVAKAREHMVAMAESKATNRAIRDLLTLRASYPKAELVRPFAVFRWEPNMAHPQVAERFLDNLLPATTAVYGPDPRQVEAGAEPAYEVAPHRVDDDDQDDADDVAEAEYREVQVNGHAKVDVATGEIVASTPAADQEPSWFNAAAAAPAPIPALALRLRAVADANPDKTGHRTDAQVADLRPLLAPLGQEVAEAGLMVAFDLGHLSALQQRHGQAILEVAGAMGAEAFRAEWREMAAGAR